MSRNVFIVYILLSLVTTPLLIFYGYTRWDVIEYHHRGCAFEVVNKWPWIRLAFAMTLFEIFIAFFALVTCKGDKGVFDNEVNGAAICFLWIVWLMGAPFATDLGMGSHNLLLGFVLPILLHVIFANVIAGQLWKEFAPKLFNK